MTEFITGKLNSDLSEEIRPEVIMFGIRRDLEVEYANKPEFLERRLLVRATFVIGESLGLTVRKLSLSDYIKSIVGVRDFLLLNYPAFFPSLIDYEKIRMSKG